MLFVTSGYLLQKVKNEGAEALERYSCIILDEVHERSAENDLVLAIVRSLTPPQTKIVLMSATPNHRRLRDYFASSPSGARGEEEMQSLGEPAVVATHWHSTTKASSRGAPATILIIFLIYMLAPRQRASRPS